MSPRGTCYRNRPPEERLGHQVTVTLNDADADILDRVARATGRTKVEAVRLAIREFYTDLREAHEREPEREPEPDPNPNRPPVRRSNSHLPPVWVDIELLAWMLECPKGERIEPTERQTAEAGGRLLELVRGTDYPIGAYDLLEVLQFVWLASAENAIHPDKLIPEIAKAMRRHAAATTEGEPCQ